MTSPTSPPPTSDSPRAPMDLLEERSSARLLFWGLGHYADVLRLQERLRADRLAGATPDVWLVGEHPFVITQGVRATDADLLGQDCASLMAPIYKVDRGGMTTLHSPGQLILYPIVKVAGGSLAAGGFSRALLETMRAWIGSEFGVATETPERRPGLYVAGRKLLSVGVSVRQGVSMHGVALNMANDLDLWKAIVPCGEPSIRPITLSEIVGRKIEPAQQIRSFAKWLAAAWGYGEVEAGEVNAAEEPASPPC